MEELFVDLGFLLEKQMATTGKVIKCKGPCFLILVFCLFGFLLLVAWRDVEEMFGSMLFLSDSLWEFLQFYSHLCINSSADLVMLACSRGSPFLFSWNFFVLMIRLYVRIKEEVIAQYCLLCSSRGLSGSAAFSAKQQKYPVYFV